VSTIFISDLHLHPARPRLVKLFEKFLNSLPKNAQALYILGDFFEAWVGADDPDYSAIAELLKNTAKKIPLYFMPGNRDFLINEAYMNSLGINFLPDPTLITLYGRKILLAHGDGLCTQDKSYQRYRRIVRIPILQKIFLALPLSFRKKVARKLRQDSQTQFQQNPKKRYQEIDKNTAIKLITQYQADLIIHGHIHKAGIDWLNPGQNQIERVVLGDWHDDLGSVLVINEDELNLIPFIKDSLMNDPAI